MSISSPGGAHRNGPIPRFSPYPEINEPVIPERQELQKFKTPLNSVSLNQG